MFDSMDLESPTDSDDHCSACGHSKLLARSSSSIINGNDSRYISLYRQSSYSAVTIADDSFVHINEWFERYGGNPCSRTETIYLDNYRNEEPVQSNMDISTGHIVLVSIYLEHQPPGQGVWHPPHLPRCPPPTPIV